jgi:hypothetical protein
MGDYWLFKKTLLCGDSYKQHAVSYNVKLLDNNERMWKEEVAANIEVLSQQLAGMTEKNDKSFSQYRRSPRRA